MNKYIVFGSGSIAIEIVNTLLSLKQQVIVIDSDYYDEGIKNDNLTVYKKKISDDYFKDNLNLSEIKTLIVLAGKRFATNIDDTTSLLLGNKKVIEDVDAKTIMKVMEIRKIFDLNLHKSIRIIAEMIEERNERLFLDAGVDEIIPTDKLIEKIMVQMVFNEGIVSELILKLLTRNDKGYLSNITVTNNSEYKEFLGKTYDGLLKPLLEKGMQLIAINRTNNIETKGIISSTITDRFIINPVKESEKNYSLRDKDRLVVLKAVETSKQEDN